MKKKFKTMLSLLLLTTLGAQAFLTGCTRSEKKPGTTTENTTATATQSTMANATTEKPNDPVTPPITSENEGVDIFLFIGQSNMAGRGASAAATKVPEGHAYEFRAISDPSKLYPVVEPFGVNENNAQSGVNENKKSGSMVSAFCEEYYQKTGTPIVAISCSKGGEKISFFDTDTAVFEDAVNRVRLAKEHLKGLYDSGKTEFRLKNTYVVWLQGESDGDAGTSAEKYRESLDKIVKGFEDKIGSIQTFVIPIGTYNGNDGAKKAKYQVIRDAQITYCESTNKACVICTQLPDLHRFGFMKDQFHFKQEGYEIIGKDAASNAAYYTLNFKKPNCKSYFAEEAETRENGAFCAENGRVVIPASAAAEMSRYASYSTGANNLTWAKTTSGLDGIAQVGANGSNWPDIAHAHTKAPQVHYAFSISEPGRYYLYMLTSHPDSASNSVYAAVDNMNLIECENNSYGAGIWMSNSSWYFDIESAGEHTVHIYAREDGIILNQVILSKNASESFENGKAEKVSKRSSYKLEGMFVETNGKVAINLATALENSNYAYTVTGSANNMNDVFRWEASTGFEGVQVYPDKGVSWSTNNISPKLCYVVDFSTPGDYYVMLRTTYKADNADSVYISVDNGKIHNLSVSSATGVNKWIYSDTWKITVPYAGIHTIQIFAREDGAAIHELYLTKEKQADGYPVSSPRLPHHETNKYTAYPQGTVIAAEGGKSEFDIDLALDNKKYTVYASVNAKANATVQYTVNQGEIQTFSFGKAVNGWIKIMEAEAPQNGKFTVSSTAADAEFKYLYIIPTENDRPAHVETLILGDSYTSMTAWKRLIEHTQPIGGMSIGIGGTKVASWMKNPNGIKFYNPKNIVINIGVNDIDSGIDGTTCGNSIIELIKEYKKLFPDAKIFYVSVCDNDMYPEKWGEYKKSNETVKAYADTDDSVYFIDFASVMKAESHNMANNGFRDKLHLSAKAYELYAEIVVNAVLQANKAK